MYELDDKIKIGVLGSCVSRDVFNRIFVPNYKDFFEIVISATRVSMISLMQEPVKIDDGLLKILPDNQRTRHRTWNIKYDIHRDLLKELLEKDIDYLIIDNYLEVIFGILCFDNNIISYSSYLEETNFLKNLKSYNHFRMHHDSEEYFKLWSKNCDLFFSFLNENCPNLKVILNKARPLDTFLKEDGSKYVFEEYTKRNRIFIPLIDKLDRYIEENFDVEIIEFDEKDNYLDENHHWGKGPVHYINKYYSNFMDDLTKIIFNDLISKKKEMVVLHHQNTKLTERNKILTNTKEDLFYKNNFLNQKIISISETNAQIINRNRTLTRTKTNLFNEKVKLSEEINNLNNQLTNTAEINNIKNDLDSKCKEFENIKKELNSKNDLITVQKQEMLLLNQKIDTLTSDLIDKNYELNSIKMENKLLSFKYKSQNNSIKKIIEEKNAENNSKKNNFFDSIKKRYKL